MINKVCLWGTTLKYEYELIFCNDRIFSLLSCGNCVIVKSKGILPSNSLRWVTENDNRFFALKYRCVLQRNVRAFLKLWTLYVIIFPILGKLNEWKYLIPIWWMKATETAPSWSIHNKCVSMAFCLLPSIREKPGIH